MIRSESKLILIEAMDTFTINLVWTGVDIIYLKIVKTLRLLPEVLKVATMFNDAYSNPGNYHLTGLVLYGMGHYVSCFIEEATNTWVVYDDTRMTNFVSSSSLFELTTHCVKYNFYPTIAIYSHGGSPI